MRHREDKLKNRSLADGTSYQNLTAVPFDNALYDPQPESRAFLSLGADKWFEHGAANFPWNSAARVGDQNGYLSGGAAQGFPVPGTDGQRSAIDHCILRVHNQVRQQLPELVGGAFHLSQFPKLLVDLDAGLRKRPGKQGQRVFDDAIQIEGAEVSSITVQAEHLANNARDAISLILQCFINGLGGRVEAITQQIDRIFDCLHGIVDLVGDGAGELAGSGELLHLEHAPLHLQLLETLPGGEVTEHG